MILKSPFHYSNLFNKNNNSQLKIIRNKMLENFNKVSLITYIKNQMSP